MTPVTGSLPSITLLPFDAESPLFEDALRVYGQTWPEDDPDESRAMFTDYAGCHDFIGLVASVNDSPAGVGYGARSYPGIWWHDEVALRLGSDHPALQDVWRLVELAVDPDYQGLGIGGRIHDALLVAQPCPRALIATAVSNTRARGMYERRGWTYVCEPLLLPGKAEAHAILGRQFSNR